jgi:membrane protease subunit HflK
MPWSNQSGGGGGGGGWKGGGPWGQPPGGGGGNQQPDLEEILKRSQDRLKQAMPGGGLSKGFMLLIGLVALAVIGFLGFTVRVNPDEQGIVTRFGAFHRQLAPGLSFRLPPPIEEVYLPKVTALNRTEVGSFRGADGRATSTTRGSVEEGIMLTGDENIVDADFIVFWQIKDASQFLFNIRDGEAVLAGYAAQTVKDVAESAMRESMGRETIERALAERKSIEIAVQDQMQRMLDSYGAGIQVTQVQLLRVDPPQQVIEAFRDVQTARADQERLINEAQAYADSQVPIARGDAEKIKQEAQGYRERVVAEAKGQTSRFIKVYDEYKKAPDVTRQRMFLETMERVLGDMDKVIIDQKGGGQGVVPFLPLNELTKRGPATQGGQ